MNARFLIRPLLSTAVLALVMALASRIGDPLTQAYLGVFGALGVAAAFTKVERGSSDAPDGAVDPGVRVLASFLSLATVIVAALDAGRFHWGPALPSSVRLGGLILVALFGSLRVWALAVNPFFSTSLWIQPSHRPVTAGPYCFVRHPGYLAMLVTAPATAIALGSLAGLLPALAYEILILRRTMREDHFLRERLGGYAEYSGTVRDRIAPGFW